MAGKIGGSAADPVAATALGLVQQGIGAGNQRFEALGFADLCYATADRQSESRGKIAAIDGLDALTHGFTQFDGTCQRDAFEQDPELLATPARQDPSAIESVMQCLGNGNQRLIARGV